MNHSAQNPLYRLPQQLASSQMHPSSAPDSALNTASADSHSQFYPPQSYAIQCAPTAGAPTYAPAHAIPPAGNYAPSMPAHPAFPPPASPANINHMYNSLPAASAPLSAHIPGQLNTHAHLQSGLLPASNHPPLTHANPNTNPENPIVHPQVSLQAPTTPLPNATNATNRGAAADYYGDSVPNQTPLEGQNSFHPAMGASASMPPTPGVSATHQAQPLSPHDPQNMYPYTATVPSAQGHVPQSWNSSGAPEDFDEADDDDDGPADGERGLFFGGKKKKKPGIIGTIAKTAGKTFLRQLNHNSGSGYGYSSQAAYPYGTYGGGGYPYQSNDMAAFGGMTNFDYSAEVQQTLMNNVTVQSQMIAQSGSALSNLC